MNAKLLKFPTPARVSESVLTNKSMLAYLERAKGGRFEKSEINGLCKLFASSRFASEERKAQIGALENALLECVGSQYESTHFQVEIMHFKKPMKISKEQTLQGKSYLRDYYFKKDGSKRSGKATEWVSDDVLKIALKVKRFEFVGLAFVNSLYGRVQVLPIYRTFNAKGESYDYSPIHWAQPLIITGHL